jgi:hypothetical protein
VINIPRSVEEGAERVFERGDSEDRIVDVEEDVATVLEVGSRLRTLVS